MNHEKTHLKEKIIKKENDAETPKINRKSFRGGVNEHNNTNGPPCFICGAVCKDSANYRNHILSHYYRSFDDHVPARKPFTCPVCQKESRDKITLIRWDILFRESDLSTFNIFLFSGILDLDTRKFMSSQTSLLRASFLLDQDHHLQERLHPLKQSSVQHPTILLQENYCLT